MPCVWQEPELSRSQTIDGFRAKQITTSLTGGIMNAVQLAKIWSVTGLCCLFFTLNSWIASQGGTPIFGVLLLHSGRVPAAWLGIPITSVLLLVTAVVGCIHAARTSGPWHERIPILGFDSLDTKSPEGQAYQGAFLCLFTLVPMLALVHFWGVALSAKVALNGSTEGQLAGMWDHRGLLRAAMICDEFKPETKRCENGVSIDPVEMPLIFALLTVLAYCYAIRLWWYVFRRKT